MTANKYKFALIQLLPKDVAVEDNFKRAEAFIRDAASRGCHLAVLPEYHLTSWCPDHPDFLKATEESNSYVSRYQDLARELNINIVPGTICDVHPAPASTELKEGDRELRNMTYFIEAGSGTVVATYQKKNLWHSERPHLTAGKATPHTAFDTPFKLASPGGTTTTLRAGMLVCWDLAFPEAFRALIADGAHLIIVVSYWYVTDVSDAMFKLNPRGEEVFLNATVVSRAFENTAAVVFVNAGGLTQVAVPVHGALGDGPMAADVEGMQVVDVDLDVLRLSEENYKVREDIRRSDWHYGYELINEGEGRARGPD